MSKIWEKIDKFYLLYFAVMLVMAFIAIHTFRTIFQSVIAMNGTEVESNSENNRINQSMLDEAHNFIFEKNPTKLQIK